jgi:hypothetical protein
VFYYEGMCMLKSFLHTILFLSILSSYSLSSMFFQRGTNTVRPAISRVKASTYNPNPTFQSQKRLTTTGQQNSESWSNWASRLWYGPSTESNSERGDIKSKQNSNSRSYFSYVPYTRQYELEKEWENMIRVINEANAHNLPTPREIAALYEAGRSLGYDILSRTNAQGHSLLAVLIANLYKHRYLLPYVKKVNDVINQIHLYGIGLNALEKEQFQQLPLLFVEALKSDLLAYSHLTLKNYRLEDLLSIAYALNILNKLGLPKAPSIDYSKIVPFLNAVTSAENFSYEFLGSGVRVIMKGRENSIYKNIIKEYTLNGIEDMIKEGSIELLDRDIHYIMHYMLTHKIYKQKDSIVFFSDSINSKTISIKELEQAAQKGVLRESLLQEFRIKNDGSVRIYKDTGDNSAYSLLYNLLLQSNKIEHTRKLNDFSQIIYYASFIKELSSSNQGNRSNWNNNNQPGGGNIQEPKNIYELLGVSQNASKAEMKDAKIRYWKKHHPDLGTSDQDKKRRNALIANLNSLWDKYEEKYK